VRITKADLQERAYRAEKELTVYQLAAGFLARGATPDGVETYQIDGRETVTVKLFGAKRADGGIVVIIDASGCVRADYFDYWLAMTRTLFGISVYWPEINAADHLHRVRNAILLGKTA
jgi:hypothetical protein